MISILRIADDGEIWYISVSALLSGSACLSNNPRNVQYRHAILPVYTDMSVYGNMTHHKQQTLSNSFCCLLFSSSRYVALLTLVPINYSDKLL